MKLPGNWAKLVAQCRQQDKELKRHYHYGVSWHDLISEAMDDYGGVPELTRRWLDVKDADTWGAP